MLPSDGKLQAIVSAFAQQEATQLPVDLGDGNSLVRIKKNQLVHAEVVESNNDHLHLLGFFCSAVAVDHMGIKKKRKKSAFDILQLCMYY